MNKFCNLPPTTIIWKEDGIIREITADNLKETQIGLEIYHWDGYQFIYYKTIPYKSIILDPRKRTVV